MITLKLKHYDERNLDLLTDILALNIEYLKGFGECEKKDGNSCGGCEIRQICGDFCRAAEFAAGQTPKKTWKKVGRPEKNLEKSGQTKK